MPSDTSALLASTEGQADGEQGQPITPITLSYSVLCAPGCREGGTLTVCASSDCSGTCSEHPFSGDSPCIQLVGVAEQSQDEGARFASQGGMSNAATTTALDELKKRLQVAALCSLQ